MMANDMHENKAQDVQILITASEAYPALERCFLEAKSTISAGFRVFDPQTHLRSPEALAIGQTWQDLVEHTLRRGVAFRIVLTDFDPVVRPSLHRSTHLAAEGLRQAAERSGRPELLTLVVSMHAGRVGIAPRLLLWPKIIGEVKAELARLNALPKDRAEADLALMPGFVPHITGTHPDLRARLLPIPPLVPATHHQKVAVFDDEALFVGGLDLNDRRYDTQEHNQPGDETWADVQLLLRGPAAAEARRHLEELDDVIGAKMRPTPAPNLLRTLSSRHRWPAFRMAPKVLLSQVERAHLRHIGQARSLIYLESQYLRSTAMAKALAARAREMPDLQLLLVLPAAPEEVAFEDATKSDSRYGEYMQAKCVDRVIRAFGKRVFIMAPGQPRPTNQSGRATVAGSPLVYLHSKVSVFDQQTAIVSSANLNGRSLRWDTEVGVELTEPATVQDLYTRCLRHWLPDDAGPQYFDEANLVANWRALAKENAASRPDERQGFVLPYPSAVARRFGRNLPGVPEEMV